MRSRGMSDTQIESMAKRYGDTLSTPLSSIEERHSLFGTREEPKKDKGGLGNFLDKTGNIPTGIAQSALSVASNVGSFIGKQTVGRLVPSSKERIGQASESLDRANTPQNTGQQIGKTAGDIAQFFIPAGVIGKAKVAINATHAPQILKFLGLVGTEVGANTAISLGQQGEFNKQVGDTAKVTAILGGVGEGISAGASTKFGQRVVNYLKEKIPSRLVNSVLRPQQKEFDFGKNPGLTVVKEDLKANTRGGLLNKISDRKSEVGQLKQSVLSRPENVSKTIDFSDDILTPLKEAKQNAVNSGEKALFNRLDDIESGLTKTFDDQFNVVGTKNLQLDPLQADKLKQQIGNQTRWTGQAFDNDVNQVRVSIYRNLRNKIDDAVPEVADLNQRYSGLLTAEKALERTDKRMQKLVMTGLRSTGVGTATGVLTATSGGSNVDSILAGLAGTAAFKIAGSTAVKTKIAGILNDIPKDAKTRVAQNLRSLISALINQGENSQGTPEE